VVKRKEKICQ